MADPVGKPEKAKAAAPAPEPEAEQVQEQPQEQAVAATPPPATVAEAEIAALSNAQTANFSRARKNAKAQFVGPMGVRYDASPYVKSRYDPNGARLGATPLLGAPESIVKEDFRREHRGWKYAWPVTTHNQTAAYIRSGVYKPVPFSMIDDRNPLAAVAPAVNGDTTWMQHTLVAISPKWFAALYESAEIESVQRSSISRKQLEDELNEQFAKGGYAAEADVLADLRSERIL